MITLKKPSLDDLKAFLSSVRATLQTAWQDFHNREHSRNEWLLMFSLALVVGMGCKAIALRTITIGYEDYTLARQTYPVTPLPTETLTKGPLCEE
jgi:hypothetical protein